MHDETNETTNKRLSLKQLGLVAGVATLFIGSLTGIYFMMFRAEPTAEQGEGDAVQEEQTTDDSDDSAEHNAPALPDTPPSDDPYVDERETLSDTRITDLTDMALDWAYQGEWLELANMIEPIDTEYNLEDSEEALFLRGLFLDANKLVTLTALGDTPDAVDRSVDLLPTFDTDELFVLGLYYLPRNVLLEMSADHLALAPTQRGHVQLTERIDMPFTNPDGSGNDLESQDNKIASYLGSTRINEFEEGFVRFEVQNGPIEEYVYVIQQPDNRKGLMGFYSDDSQQANTTKTVGHHLEFREDVSKGIEALLNEAQDAYDEEHGSSSDDD